VVFAKENITMSRFLIRDLKKPHSRLIIINFVAQMLLAASLFVFLHKRTELMKVICIGCICKHIHTHSKL